MNIPKTQKGHTCNQILHCEDHNFCEGYGVMAGDKQIISNVVLKTVKSLGVSSPTNLIEKKAIGTPHELRLCTDKVF